MWPTIYLHPPLLSNIFKKENFLDQEILFSVLVSSD